MTKQRTHRVRTRLITPLLGCLLALAWSQASPALARQERREGDSKHILSLGHKGAREAFSSCSLPIEAVVLATSANQESRKPILTGTITVAAERGRAAVYDATPRGSLVWKRPNQKPVKFTIATFEGDLRDNAVNFLGGPHSLKYRVEVEGRMKLDVVSTREKTGFFTTRYTTTLKGTMELSAKQYEVDLKMSGKGYFESSNGGFERTDDHTLTGTVKDSSLRLTVSETYHYTAVGAGNVVTFDTRKVANRVVSGGKTYQWKDVFLKKNFKDGKVSGVDRDWACEGKVLLDDRAFANYGKEAKTAAMLYKIEAPAGTVELESWLIR